MIYTRFGTPCDIIAVLAVEGGGRIPVDILCRDEDGCDRPFSTYVHELRATNGPAEIQKAILNVKKG